MHSRKKEMCLIKIYCKIRANWKYILRVRFDFCVIKYLRNLWITTGVLPEYFLSGRIQTFRVQQTPSSSPFFSAVRNHLAVYWWRKIIHKFIKRQLNDTYRMLVKSQKCYIHWIWVKNWKCFNEMVLIVTMTRIIKEIQ